jgi:hypothetical protein
MIVKRSLNCIIQRIFARVTDCPVKEVCMPVPCAASKVNTKDVSGEYCSE